MFGSSPFSSVEDIKKWQQQQQERAKQIQKQMAKEMADPLGRGHWVKLAGLKTTSLNGKLGEIVLEANSEDRFAVRVLKANSTRKTKKILIKRINLQALPASETIKVCRLNAQGESGGCAKTLIWPRAVLESARYPSCVSPVSRLLGFPLYISRVKPHSKLTSRAAMDNQWATYMMINPSSGFAPMQWQSHVGPVIVWRRDGAVSADDMTLLNDFLCNLMDQYADGAVTPADLTPARWAREKKILLEFQTRHGLGFSNDVNI